MSLQAFSLDVSSMVEHIYNKPVSSLSLTSCLTKYFQELVGSKATIYSIDNSTSQSVRNIYIQVRVAPIFFLNPPFAIDFAGILFAKKGWSHKNDWTTQNGGVVNVRQHGARARAFLKSQSQGFAKISHILWPAPTITTTTSQSVKAESIFWLPHTHDSFCPVYSRQTVFLFPLAEKMFISFFYLRTKLKHIFTPP